MVPSTPVVVCNGPPKSDPIMSQYSDYKGSFGRQNNDQAVLGKTENIQGNTGAGHVIANPDITSNVSSSQSQFSQL